MEKRRSAHLGDFGDYSTKVITGNNLSMFVRKGGLFDWTQTIAKHLITGSLVAAKKWCDKPGEARSPLEFLTKIWTQLGLINFVVIFFLVQQATIFVAATLIGFHKSTCFQPSLLKFTTLLLGPAMELVQAGKGSGGASGDIARSPATSMHWERRTVQIKPQLQACCLAHFARMPGRLKYHLNI